MADDATIAIGTWPCRADGRRRRRSRRSSASRAASARCRSNSCAPIRATRAGSSPTPSSTSLRALDPRARHHSADRGAPGARRRQAFEIIAGERRWRAAQRAGLHEVPIVVLEVSDAEALELAIIENIQRADLNPLEEAAGYQALAIEYSHSQDDIAQDRRQEPQPCRQHAAAAEAAGDGQGLYQRRQADRRPCARADQSARSGGSWREQIVEKGLNVRQVEALRAGERQKAGKKQSAARAGAEGCRHRGAREAAVGRARPRGRRSTDRGRGGGCCSQLSHARPARRSGAAAGAGADRLSGPTGDRHATRIYEACSTRIYFRRAAHRQHRASRAARSPRQARAAARFPAARRRSCAIARAAAPRSRRATPFRSRLCGGSEAAGDARLDGAERLPFIDRDPRMVQAATLAQRAGHDRAGSGASPRALRELRFDLGGFPAKAASITLSSATAEASATTASTSSSVTRSRPWT